MKRVICFIVSLFLVFSLTACGKPAEEKNEIEETPFTENNVTVLKDAFPENTKIKIDTVTDTADIKAALPAAKAVEAYDITAFLDEQSVQPSGEVEVSFPLPASYNEAEHNIEVYFIPNSGVAEKVEADVVDGKVVAKLSHFSIYAVVLVEKLQFNLAVNGTPTFKDGKKSFVSDINLTFEFNDSDSWQTFAEKAKDKGFSVDKDFYGKEDLVYFTYDGVKYQVVQVSTLTLKPTEKIDKDIDYACILPHRETIQQTWLYDVSEKEFYVEGYIEPFHKSGKELTLNTQENTFTIKYLRYQKTGANSHILLDEIVETGTYTSTDGDTLGTTLTLSNGYVIKTTRSSSFVAELITGGETKSIKTADVVGFYD